MRGWGSPSSPDPVLFVPRGFDAGAQRFRYDVNPRFADTRPNRAVFREPFRIVIDFSLQLSTDYGLQQLRRAVEPVKTSEGWRRRSADSIAAFYLSSSSSVYKALLEESDSLLLTRAQVTALKQADSVFSDRVIGVYRPLGEYLARGNGAAGKAEMDSASTVKKAYWRIFWEQPEIADTILTSTQKSLFPMLGHMLGVTKKDRENSQFQFGRPVKMPTAPPSAKQETSAPLPKQSGSP